MPAPFSQTMRTLHADRPTWTGLVLVVLLLIAWAVWFFGSRVSVYAVSDAARLEIEQAAHPVVSPVDGQVVEAHMILGADVNADAVLFELDVVPLSLQREEEQAQHAGLEAQLDALRREIAAEQRALADALQVGQSAYEEAQARYEEAQAASQLAEQNRERMQRLHEQGHVSDAEFERVQSEAEQQRLAAEARRRTVARLEAEQRSTESDRRALMARLNQDAAVLERQLATTQAQVKQLDHEVERHRVRAPVGGRLAQMRPLRKGSLVQAGDTLGVVVQPGALRVVAYFLPSAAFGRIWPGQAAQLRLHGFPWTQYGSVEATVERVAGEALSEGVRVEFSIDADGARHIPLQHGLPGSIEVEVERMSPAMLVLQAAGKRVTGRGSS